MMRHTHQLIVLLLLTLISVSPLLAADLPFEAGITRHVTDLTKGDSSGLALLVACDGKIIYQACFGLANIAAKTPITPDTKFRIGSISRQFTAAAVLKLAEQRRLSLDDPLSKYFPKFPHSDDVTLRHLLTHTSGLHSYKGNRQ